jgi:hypothetical protein
MKRLVPLCMLTACLQLVSCAGVRQVGQKSAQAVRDTSSKLSSFSLADLLPGSRINVVKVREKDLKELPTGRERALAFQNSRKGGFWIFGGPVDFKEPTLPEAASEPDGSLLPPKIQ